MPVKAGGGRRPVALTPSEEPTQPTPGPALTMAAAASLPAALATDAPPCAGCEAVPDGSGRWAAALAEVTGVGCGAGNVWGLCVGGGGRRLGLGLGLGFESGAGREGV